jgi:hypothetical protein
VSRVIRSTLSTAAVLALGAAGAGARDDVPQPRQPARGLPNLAMHRITDVAIAPLYDREGRRVAGRWAVRFTSIVDNRGPGDFVLRVHREATGQPCLDHDDAANRCEAGDMTADQVVIAPNGGQRIYPGVGVAYFDDNHNHWHLRAGERYGLQTASGRTLDLDAKTGFCFGDRLYYTPRRPPNHPGLRNDLVNCGPGNGDPALDGRRALSLLEGISAGWSDDYPSYESDGSPLEGQQLEITKLPEGRYRLINQVNPAGRFRETTRKDDSASVLFALTWPGGARPSIAILASCVRTAHCRARG